MKVGDVVTFSLRENQEYSNTYIITAFHADDQVFLHHPLKPEVNVLAPAAKLDTVIATPKNPQEYVMSYVVKNKQHLSYLDRNELDDVVLFFIVNRFFTARQKGKLSELVEKVMRIYCQEQLHIAYQTCLENANVLLADEFNGPWYHAFKKHIQTGNIRISPKQQSCIYRMAGFVMAQNSL